MPDTTEKCWIFGDESGQIDSGRFFAIGVLGTQDPKAVIGKLKELRDRAGYPDEISYKYGNNKMALCAIKWMDWFFGGQDILKFKIVLKDLKEYDIKYYENNAYGIGAKQLAYCVSYHEVIGNFANFNDVSKGLIYSQTGLIKEEVEKYLEGKVSGLGREDCFTRSTKDKKRNSQDFTGAAEILQLCDLLTSSTRGLCCSLFGEEKEGNWVKNCLRKNIHYHIPEIKDRLKDNKNVYFPDFNKQVFTVYKWTGGQKRQRHP